MKILFYDWSLHIIGGGQKVNCKIIEHLSKKHKVDVLTLYPIEKKILEKYYSVDLSKVLITNLFNKTKIHTSLLKLFASNKVSNISKNYDLFFNGDAQEAINPKAEYNIMYCHFFEFKWYRPSRGLFDFFKLILLYIFRTLKGNYSKKYKVYCNSLFTKKWLKKLWKLDAEIIYPFIEIPNNLSGKKQNLIISTGRLSPDKNYEFFIDCFKEIYDSVGKDYRGIIAATVDKKSEEYYNTLIKRINNYPIEIRKNLNNKEINQLCNRSKIFLMGKGLGIDETKYPALLENFGMSPVEAMSYGCVPVVLNKAGYKETVENNKSGFLFNSKKEAIRKLKHLIKDDSLRKKMSKNSVERAKKFSLQRMQKEIDEILKNF